MSGKVVRIKKKHIYFVISSVVDRKRFDADPNPTFRFDADQNPDPDPDPNSSLTHGKSDLFLSFIQISFYIVLPFLVSIKGVIIFNILDSTVYENFLERIYFSFTVG
jgi:hypothetical protein